MIAVLVAAGNLRAGVRVRLDAEEIHHIAVRRAGFEAQVTVLDGAGWRGAGRLVPDGRGLAVEVDRAHQEPRPVSLTLAVGAGDRDRFGILIEQAAQLGVTAVVPLETERSVNVASRVRAAHLERLRRRAREALKQCEACWAPEVYPPMDLETFLRQDGASVRWLAEQQGSPHPGPIDPTAPLAVVVGPEGGLSPDEIARCRSAGYIPVRLGPHCMRFETAAVAALSTAWQVRQRDSHD